MKTETKFINQKIGQWTIVEKIGEGSFGCIYSAQNTEKHQECAMKTELLTNVKQMLLLEYQVYRQFSGVKGFPEVYEYGEEDRFSYLVMEKLEVTLDKHAAMTFPKQFLPANTLLQVMYQTIQIIEQMHMKGYIYRDLKPANLMLKKPYNEIYLIDFGLCKKYLVNNRHIPLKTNKKLVGTPLFCSIHTHSGLEQSRRDDLESWLWTCLYLCFQLPWENILSKKQLTKEEQYEEIHKIKKSVQWDEYISKASKNLKYIVPTCLVKLIDYVRGLGFEEEPNYAWIQKILQEDYYRTFKNKLNTRQISWDPSPSEAEEKEPEIGGKSEGYKKIGKINFKAPRKGSNGQQNKLADQKVEYEGSQN